MTNSRNKNGIGHCHVRAPQTINPSSKQKKLKVRTTRWCISWTTYKIKTRENEWGDIFGRRKSLSLIASLAPVSPTNRNKREAILWGWFNYAFESCVVFAEYRRRKRSVCGSLQKWMYLKKFDFLRNSIRGQNLDISTKSWQRHDKVMTKSWQSHDKVMTKSVTLSKPVTLSRKKVEANFFI